MCTLNTEVNYFNKIIQERLPGNQIFFCTFSYHWYVSTNVLGELKTLRSFDTISDRLDGELSQFSDQFLNSINDPSAPTHEIELKVNDYCFLTATIAIRDGATNNSKVQILHFYRYGILVRLLSNNQRYIITRKHFKIEVKSRRRNVISFTLLRRQYPLRLCYAMTFNKSQGQTLNRVSIDLRFHVFTHGQLYVALGRATKRSDVLALITADNVSLLDPSVMLTTNVVHQILLRNN